MAFCQDLLYVIRSIPNVDKTILLGEFNARVGHDHGTLDASEDEHQWFNSSSILYGIWTCHMQHFLPSKGFIQDENMDTSWTISSLVNGIFRMCALYGLCAVHAIDLRWEDETPHQT